ncbi:hypothetical protein N1031_00080 [Herbiconiux moechotypicola]|uniref:Lipoprotein n=1 Tax=Herbiconiux moechotypicola TaxID=637393 RepID=A0ABN3D8Y4_9MICO|nr:hypothetical protein [Herbiconiux moechotypicola]MCS5728147.1 hypothetical protein [Herbiconiux moechotypicola]
MMRRRLLQGGTAGGALVVAALLGGCVAFGSAAPQGPAASTPAAEVKTRSVYGFVIIADPDPSGEKWAERQQRQWDTGDSSCTAPAGFEDVVAGGEVQVMGPSGVLATGQIEVGTWSSDVMTSNRVFGCGFPFVVEGVPEGLDEYGIHVGAESRPAYAFSASELRSGPRLFLP